MIFNIKRCKYCKMIIKRDGEFFNREIRMDEEVMCRMKKYFELIDIDVLNIIIIFGNREFKF